MLSSFVHIERAARFPMLASQHVGDHGALGGHIGKSLVTSTCLTGKVTCVTCADFLLGKSPQVKNLTCAVGPTSQSSGVDLGTYLLYDRRDRRLSTSARPFWLVHRLLVTNGACGRAPIARSSTGRASMKIHEPQDTTSTMY